MRYIDGSLARVFDWDEQPIWYRARELGPEDIRRRLRRYRWRHRQWRGERAHRTRRHERR